MKKEVISANNMGIKEIIARIVQLILGSSVEQSNNITISQNRTLSENIHKEIENMSNEFKP